MELLVIDPLLYPNNILSPLFFVDFLFIGDSLSISHIT